MRFWWIPAAAVLAVAGCGSDKTDGDGKGGAGGISTGGSGGTAGDTGGTGGGGSGGSGGSTGGAGGDGGTGGGVVIPTDETDLDWDPEPPLALDDPMNGDERPDSCGSRYGFASAVRGWAVAPGGKALPGAKAQVCVYPAEGVYTCLAPATAGADGVYTVAIPESLRCFDEAAMRLVLPTSNRAASYCALPKLDEPALKLYDPGVLPFANPAIDLPPLGDEQAPRVVKFDDGLEIEAIPSQFEPVGNGSYRDFSGRRIPTEAVGLCGEAPEFDGLYAFYPEGYVEGPGYATRIPNVDGFAAGTKVDLFVLGGLECMIGGREGRKVPEAVWENYGAATVSDDGAFIVSDANSGLPCLNWLAYRARN